MRQLVYDGERSIGWLTRGPDGTWWLTLNGRVPTTLGPDLDRSQLLERGVRSWRRHNLAPNRCS